MMSIVKKMPFNSSSILCCFLLKFSYHSHPIFATRSYILSPPPLLLSCVDGASSLSSCMWFASDGG